MLLELLGLSLTLVVNAPDVVLHVVHAGEDAGALFAIGAVPLALDAWVVLGLVTGAVFLAGEAACQGLVGGLCACGRGGLALRAVVDPAEEVLAVAVVVLAQIAAAGEGCARCATGIRAAPGLSSRAA